MNLEITRDELALLKECLDTRRREVHEELVHTDDRAFKAGSAREARHRRALDHRARLTVQLAEEQPLAPRELIRSIDAFCRIAEDETLHEDVRREAARGLKNLLANYSQGGMTPELVARVVKVISEVDG
jgi:hypothetical protein